MTVVFCFCNTFFIAEYSTERELLTSLQNDTEDKVWLFNCQEKEINQDLDFMIVSVLDDELLALQKLPTLGVKVQFLNRSNFDQNFTECLKMSEMPPENKTGDVNDDDDDDDDDDDVDDLSYEDHGYSLFWETDVRKHCLILFSILFVCVCILK